MISVVIPVLNEEQFLPKCLESLMNQDHGTEFEIIIVDNGSTDNTLGIPQVSLAKIITCPQKQDVFCARQAGVEAAKGEIIAQADADTIYPRDWLTRIERDLTMYPEVAAVTGRFIYNDPPYWAKIEYFLRMFVNFITLALFRRPLLISGANFAFRRKAFLEINGYRTSRYSPDQYDISSRLSKVGKIVYDPKLVVLTSARAVEKPFSVIVKDALWHVGCYFRHSLVKAINGDQITLLQL